MIRARVLYFVGAPLLLRLCLVVTVLLMTPSDSPRDTNSV